MLQSKIYVKRLISILIVIFGMTYIYVYIYSYYYPLPILSRVSLDAKLKFIRENIDIKKVDTIIVGSSIGLNNVNGSVLENYSIKCKSVLNLSGFELRPRQVEQLLDLRSVFPNLKRIIYSAQFSDFSAYETLHNYDVELLKRYISKKETILDEITILSHAFSNVFSCIMREFNWDSKYQSSNKFSYLGFDRTGSVSLHIYGDDIIKFRWETPHGAEQDLSNDIILERMISRVEEAGIDFYFILQPNRLELVKKFKHVKDSLINFEKRVKKIVEKDDAYFLNLHELLQLPDRYFSDRTHLNGEGSIVTSRAIANFIDNEK